MMVLGDEVVRELIDANQVAIKQLGEDVARLNRRLDERWGEVDSVMVLVRRDINARWMVINRLTEQVEDCLGVKK